MKKLFFLVLIGCLGLFTQCKKDKLPSVTTSGRDTFGCKINGSNWVANEGLTSSASLDVRYSEIGEAILISANNGDGQTVKVGAIISMQEGRFPLIGRSSTPLIGFDCEEYEVDTSAFGEVNILRFDAEEMIVAGEFEFTAVGIENCTDTIKVTAGRFDAVYRF